MLFGRGFWAALWQCASVYYACAALLHFVVPQIFPVRRIQSAERKRGEVERDAFCSLGPIILKAGIWTIVEVLHDRGLGKLYDGPVNSLLGISYLLFVILLLDVLHDTWFYWTHRLLHWKPLYTHVHYMHHRSRSPTAFTGYSFHIIEAAIVFANEIIVCFLFPIHVELHRAYHMVTSIIHQGGEAPLKTCTSAASFV
ncbi:unnamed protein product [Ostreobium quekettii]|uniref:Fatty acid hydroxylase domain-containing protein n=1 Tax=Ostreobium quekettii TaxID=121088 RepID=A0A8S1J880_9CHLO|nr:unnamed protein product [Ostreobium quekettii]